MKLPRILFSPKVMIFISALMISEVVLESCGPKPPCGTKSQHRKRNREMRKMAPTMMGK